MSEARENIADHAKRVADALDSIKMAMWTIAFSVALWATMAIKAMQ